MRLTVVGSSGSFPSAESAASCYLVEHDGYRLVLDMGQGSLGALQRYTALDAIDAIALSHLHPDHCIDLTGYYVVRKYHPDGHLGKIPVLAPSGAADRMARAYDVEPAPGLSNEFDFIEVDEASEYTFGPFTVTARRVVHPVLAYAYRVEAGGRVLTYSGDTGPSDALVEHAQNSDVALFEASFVSSRVNPPNLHLTGAEAADHANRANAKRLVLTHLVAWNDPQEVEAEARVIFNGPLSVAKAGEVIEV